MCASFAGASWFMLEAELCIVQGNAGVVIFHKRLLAWSLMAGSRVVTFHLAGCVCLGDPLD